MRPITARVKWLQIFILGLFLAAVPFRMSSVSAAPQLLQEVDGQPAAPDFVLPDLDGNQVRLSDFLGKVVIVNFWATWCPPCRQEIPSMQRAWNRMKDEGVMMLALHVGGNEDKIWTFLNDFNVEFPVLIDAKSKVSKGWQMFGLPTTYIIDPGGRIVLRAIGGREWDDPGLVKQILSLRKAP